MIKRKELFLGLALALALRAGFALDAAKRAPLPTSLGDFEVIALNLLDHGEYAVVPGTPTAEREPGYVLFIAAVYRVARDPRAVILVQILLGAATAWLTGLLAGAVFGASCARLAFWICVFYPYFIYYPAYFFRETLCAALLTSALLCLVRFEKEAWSAAAGAALGFLSLCNFALSPACAFLVPASWFAARERTRRLRRCAFLAAPLVLLIGAWVVRNALVLRAFVPGSTLVGIQTYISLTIPYEALGTPEQTRLYDADPIPRSLAGLSEVAQHRAFSRASVEIVRRDPLGFAAGCAGRFVKMWRVLPYRRNFTHSDDLIRAAALLSDGWIVPLALLGLLLERRNRIVTGFFASTLVITSLVYSISNAPIRYRMPVMPLVIVLAAQGAMRARGYLETRLRRNDAPA